MGGAEEDSLEKKGEPVLSRSQGPDSWAGRGMLLRKDRQGMNTPAPKALLWFTLKVNFMAMPSSSPPHLPLLKSQCLLSGLPMPQSPASLAS